MSGAAVAAVVGLGAFHGLNPAMGWLFAVALGLQESPDPRARRRAAMRALPPIAAGHLLSVAAVAAVFAVTASAVTSRAVPVAAGLLLVGMGLWRLLSDRHFKWVGMRLTRYELGTWSDPHSPSRARRRSGEVVELAPAEPVQERDPLVPGEGQHRPGGVLGVPDGDPAVRERGDFDAAVVGAGGGLPPVETAGAV